MREIASANVTQATADSLHEVVLVAMAFDEPVYAHDGIGIITYDSNDYLGVGHLGAVSEARESELLTPAPLTLSLSGVDANSIRESLNSGNYGDAVTLYVGFKGSDGLLVDDPVVVWKGTYEHATIRQGDDNRIEVTLQHDLASLADSNDARFSDEYHRTLYSADDGFEFIAEQEGLRLQWGGRTINATPQGGGGGSRRGGGSTRVR